jgi:non-structural maintenance of chromosomes element 1
VNTTSDPQTQLATLFTPDEIAFVRRVLDAMFETNNTPEREVMAVKGNDAVNLARVRSATQTQHNTSREESATSVTQMEQTQAATVAGITKDRAEGILEDLVDAHWFDRSAHFYSLSTRGIMELGPWLVATYNDPQDDWKRIKVCGGCRKILTVGQRCANDECNCRLHDFCAKGLFQRQEDGERKCPACQTAWSGNRFVGERAARREGPTNLGGRRSTGVRLSMR